MECQVYISADSQRSCSTCDDYHTWWRTSTRHRYHSRWLARQLIDRQPASIVRSLTHPRLSATAAISIDQERRVLHRHWRQFDVEAFTGDLQCSIILILLSSSVWYDYRHQLMFVSSYIVYDWLMRSLLDKHASQLFICAIRRQCALCYEQECRAAKVKQRKLKTSSTPGHSQQLSWMVSSFPNCTITLPIQESCQKRSLLAEVILEGCGQTSIVYYVTTLPIIFAHLKSSLDYFQSKVTTIRSNARHRTKVFNVFDPVTVEKVIILIRISCSTLLSWLSSNMVVET